MKRVENLRSKLTYKLVDQAVREATKGHRSELEVIEFNNLKDWNKEEQSFHQFCDSDPIRRANVQIILEDILTGNYKNKIQYRKFTKRNTNGKWRKINCPSFITRCYQHTLLLILSPLYLLKDNNNGFNCKKGYGILAKNYKRSFSHKVKSMFYERRDLNYYLVIDQRKCYDHITRKWFRRSLKNLTTDKFIIDFAVDICFIGDKLPIGTPTSPLVHHICLLKFDLWVKKELTKNTARYADDNFLGFNDKNLANQAKWRIQNFWWYEYGVRVKTSTMRLSSFDTPLIICGYKYYRLPRINSNHNKGLMLMIPRTIRRMMKTKNPKSITSYIGLAIKSDQFNQLNLKLDKMPSLEEVTKKIKLKHRWNARYIDIKELVENDLCFNIYDYEFSTTQGKEYIRLKIGIREGARVKAHILQGGFSMMARFLEMIVSEGIDPKSLTDNRIERFGSYYIFKNSIELIDYINESVQSEPSKSTNEPF